MRPLPSSPLAALVALLSCATPAPSSRLDGAKLVVDGHLELGWWLSLQEGGRGTVSAEDGVLRVKVLDPGRRPWAVIAGAGDFPLEEGHVYEVSFEARSRELPRLEAAVSMSHPPYLQDSGTHIFMLGPEFHRFGFTFKMRREGDPHCNFGVRLGRLGEGTAELRDVRLVDRGPGAPDVVRTDVSHLDAARMRRGVALGNALDAPHEGAWGVELRPELFDRIAQAGLFDHVRVTVRWNTHAARTSPYTIDPAFFRRVDWAVSEALARGLSVVLNMQYFDELVTDPPAHREAFGALWRQIAEHYRGYPPQLAFELYNEPHGALDAYWNEYYLEVYDVVRALHPARTIVVSAPEWASIRALRRLELPARVQADPQLVVQFHYYVPYDFCFQGAIGNGAEDKRGHRWTGSAAERAEMDRLFEEAVAWSRAHGGVRLWNGEFVAHAGFSPEEDRLAWTREVVRHCEERGIGWAYWDLVNDTGKLLDPDAGRWNTPMLEALRGAQVP